MPVLDHLCDHGDRGQCHTDGSGIRVHDDIVTEKRRATGKSATVGWAFHHGNYVV